MLSGGLGPTHDDRTVELLARAAGLELQVVDELAAEIEGISRRIAERFGRPYAEFEEGVRKQATVPEGGRVIGIAGTAPGLVVETRGAVAVVLPGPPPELRRLWGAALEDEAVRAVLERAQAPERRILRVYGLSESAVARALAEAGGEPEGVQATICAHAGEIWVELFGEAEALANELRGALGAAVFVEDDRPVEEIVLDLARGRGLSLGTAESCTGGLVAARLTSVPGASDVFRGGIVAYENEVKVAPTRRAGVGARRAWRRLGRDRCGDGRGRSGGRRGGRGRSGHGHRRPRRRISREARRARLPPRGRPERGRRPESFSCPATAKPYACGRPRRRSTSCARF